MEIGKSQIALRRRVSEFRSLMIKLHGLGLLASLPVDEAGVDHGEGGAARGGFDEGVEGPIGVGADATVAVLEALPPEEQRHGLPQRPQRLAPGAAHQ